MWWCAIRVDKEELRRRRSATAAARTAALSATACCAIDELAAIGADLIRSNVVSERGCAALTQAITHQFVATTTAKAATANARWSRGFQIKHLTIDAGLQIEVLTLRHVRNRYDPLL